MQPERGFPESLPLRFLNQDVRNSGTELMEMIHSEDARDAAVIDILEKLTTGWQSFACDPMPDAKSRAIQRLVLSGLAMTRLEYRVANFDTGDWILLRFVLSGQFVGDPVLRLIAAQCPPNWFDWNRMEPAAGVSVSQDHNDWTLAITDDGSRLRHLPNNRELLLETVRCHNSLAVVRKDGRKQGRGNTDEAVTFNTQININGDGYTEDDRERDAAVADRVLVQDRTPVSADLLSRHTGGVSSRTIRNALTNVRKVADGSGGGHGSHAWEYCEARDTLRNVQSGRLASVIWPDTAVELQV